VRRAFAMTRWAALAVLSLSLSSPGPQTAVGAAPTEDLRGKLAFCFAPDSDEAVVRDLLSRAHPETGLSPFQFPDGNRWQATVNSPAPLNQGDPTVITWSLIPDGTSIAGFNGEPTSNSNLIAFLNGIYPGGQAQWQPIFEDIFEDWSQISGLSYVFEPNDDGAPLQFGSRPDGAAGVRGDVRIGGHFIDGNSNVLAYNFFPSASGDMVIDTGDAFFANTSNDSLGLRNVLTHEHGHGLGFNHVCPVNQTKLMEPFVSSNFLGVQLDDQLAAQRGYGDDLEHNDTPGTATAAGTLDKNGFAFADVSVDGTADVDYYAFSLDLQARIEVNLTPIGASYLDGPQIGQFCSAGTTINTQAFNDIGFQILAADGVTSLVTVDDFGAGVAEALVDFDLDPGDYFLRVFPGPTDQVQLYEVDAAVTEFIEDCDYFDVMFSWLSDNPSCLGLNLTILPIVAAISDGAIVSP